MKVLDPGHIYELAHLDGDSSSLLIFVKRMGEKYPGNDCAREGVTTQEVLRALIDRLQYVDNQHPWDENKFVIKLLRNAIFGLEIRAARARGDEAGFRKALKESGFYSPDQIEKIPTCPKCGHIGCEHK